MSNQVFSVKNVSNVLKSVPTNAETIEQIKSGDVSCFRKAIDGKFSNVITKHIEGTTLVHLQFGHPLNLQAGEAAKIINKNLDTHQPEVNSIVFDLDSCKTLTTFDLLVPVSDFNETKQTLVKAIGNVNVGSQRRKANVPAYWIPYGMTLQCFFFNKKLVISSFTNPRLNESTFGGEQTLESVLQKILLKNGSSFDKLDQSRVYTLHLGLKQFSQIPNENDDLWIYNIQTLYGGIAKNNDPLYKCLKSLTPVDLYFKDTTDSKFVQTVLFGKNSEFQRLQKSFDCEVLMQSFIVCVDGRQFEIMTPVKELSIEFNVYRNQHPEQKNTQSLLQQFISSRVISGHSNAYVQNHLKYSTYAPVFSPISKKYLSQIPKDKLVSQKDWKTAITGNLIFEFLRELHVQVKFPLYEGTAANDEEHTQRLSKLVGVILSSKDEELLEMTYNPIMIAKVAEMAQEVIEIAKSQSSTE